MSPSRLALAAVPVAGLVALVLVLRRWPPINDVSTTPDAPPRFKSLGPERGYPPANAAVQRRAYPDLAPLELPLPAARAYELAERTASELGWALASRDPEGGRFEAVATTTLLRFKDDVVVELRPSASGCAVHARSRSRLGRGDLGANARRLRAFVDALRAKR